MERPQVAVGAIAVVDDHLCMVRRATEPHMGYWSIPGGRVEAGETMAEALVREFAEETGLDCFCGPLVGYVERIDDNFHFLIMDFEVTVLDPDSPTPGSDASEVEWVHLPMVVERHVVPGLIEFLADHGYIDVVP